MCVYVTIYMCKMFIAIHFIGYPPSGVHICTFECHPQSSSLHILGNPLGAALIFIYFTK